VLVAAQHQSDLVERCLDGNIVYLRYAILKIEDLRLDLLEFEIEVTACQDQLCMLFAFMRATSMTGGVQVKACTPMNKHVRATV
jgi:hypothetical protein